jgi:hypothetical protein
MVIYIGKVLRALSRCDISSPTCLGSLGHHDTTRLVIFSVALPKVAKASTVATVAWHCCCLFASIFAINFANLNKAFASKVKLKETKVGSLNI